MNNQPIGIFDSGVGGLTVYNEIRKKLPNENIIYLGDTKNFPYGSKTKEEIIEHSIENVKTLIKENLIENCRKREIEEVYLTKPEESFKKIAKEIMKINIKIC